MPRDAIAHQAFGEDAPWFLANIPFLEIDDADIQKVYYYRWKLYRSHLREIGAEGADETEFLTDVPWARHPYTDLNDSSSFHIMEGRWLRDPMYVTSLVNHLYAGGGNDRHFSESIAAATFAWTEVTGDPAPAIRQLPAMKHIYNLWSDHFDAERGLYWIEPILDATEYTISSIDASGAGFTESPSKKDGDNGFLGGQAFRPSINAFQFGNARAIAKLESEAGDARAASDYEQRAEALRAAVLAQLWNPKLEHFTDIYQRTTQYVTAGSFIRGRELVGYLPWMFELPPVDDKTAGRGVYTAAWKHLLDPTDLAGAYGMRTVEPSYARYLAQYRYDKQTGRPECQWNGPSWPFQSSQALTALANVLHDYPQQQVTADHYVHLLRQYTRQHIAPQGELDLQEDYDPDTGKPIVGLPRSHHYNHSTYNDLVITGLIGLRPRADNLLEVDLLLPSRKSDEKPIHYLALESLRYHGHDLSIIYDADGTKYRIGAGLSLFCDGKRIYGPGPLKRTVVPLPQASKVAMPVRTAPEDLAVNVWNRAPSLFEESLPIAEASSTSGEGLPYDAIDGRLWFFSEIANGWSPEQGGANSWYAVDMREAKSIGRVELAFFADGAKFGAPAQFRLQQLTPDGWKDIAGQHRSPELPIAGGVNVSEFPEIHTRQLRVLLEKPSVAENLRLIEIKAFASQENKTK